MRQPILVEVQKNALKMHHAVSRRWTERVIICIYFVHFCQVKFNGEIQLDVSYRMIHFN